MLLHSITYLPQKMAESRMSDEFLASVAQVKPVPSYGVSLSLLRAQLELSVPCPAAGLCVCRSSNQYQGVRLLFQNGCSRQHSIKDSVTDNARFRTALLHTNAT